MATDKAETTIQKFEKNPNRKSNLTFNFQKLTEEQIKRIVEVLKKSQTIKSVNLFSSPIGNKGAALIADGLNKTKIQKLIISNCNIKKRGGIKIGEALKTNEHLEELDISNNAIGDSAIAKIADALKTNTFIKSLNLKQTQMENQGATLLNISIVKHKSLKTLYIEGNKITHEMYSKIVATMDNIPSSFVDLPPAPPRSDSENNSDSDSDETAKKRHRFNALLNFKNITQALNDCE